MRAALPLVALPLLLAACATIEEKPAACEPGERTCESGEVVRCRDDGTGFELWQVCEAPQVCAEGVCVGGAADATGDTGGGDDSTADTGPPAGDVPPSDADGAGGDADGDGGDGGPDVSVSCGGDAECAGMPGAAPPCAVGRCVEGSCALLPGPDLVACEDGDPCTGPDVCSKGACVGVPRDCDDGNPCTSDACEAAAGCVHVANTAACSDGDACTEGDVCAEGACVPGTPMCPCAAQADCAQYEDGDLCNGSLACVDGAFCLVDAATVVTCSPSAGGDAFSASACEPASGACVPVAAPDGVPCDDGDPCTLVSTCQGGACGGAAVPCDDGNPCTDDACDPAAGCVHVANSAACDDGNGCTVGDACAEAACKPGAWLTCDDGDACTAGEHCEAGACVAGVNVCVGGSCALDSDCDDGNPCNGLEVCDTSAEGGECKVAPGTTVSCAAQNEANGQPCTAYQCDAGSGLCVQVPAAGGQPCDDGNACTVGDHCAAGACVAGGQLACQDDNACTADSCDPVVGCKHSAVPGPCEDGNPCTQGDLCAAGSCVAGGNVCPCAGQGDCDEVPGVNPCLGALVCDGAQSVCVLEAAGAVACATSSDPCVVASCDPLTAGCVEGAAPDGAICAEPTACQGPGQCVAGTCVQAPLGCSDGNPCTLDLCDPAVGCVHQPAGGACDDGDPCTLGDACSGGACQAGVSVCECKVDSDCVESPPNPCGSPACVGFLCVSVPAADGAACDDGDVCTAGDACAGGQCKGGTPACPCAASEDCAQFEDGNPCNGTLTCADGANCSVDPATVVTCDAGSASGPCVEVLCNPGTGTCEESPKAEGAACDDGDICTAVATCQSDQCLGVTAACDDGNPCTDDACDPAKGCTHAPNSQACDDGNGCTVGDACEGGACVPGPWKTCDDGDACTAGEHCQAGACVAGVKVCGGGACSVDGDCDDGDPCNGQEACDTSGALGVCKPVPGTAVSCTAQNAANEDPCTAWQCDPGAGACVEVPANGGAPCDDGTACTVADRCFDGACIAGAQLACEDGNPCTADSCGAASGCVHVPKAGPCEDGDACTKGDTCEAGVCVGGANTCECASDADCAPQEDGNPCNGTLTCDTTKAPAVCVPDPATVPSCAAPVDPCLVALCDPATGGCVEQPAADGTPCADADACFQAGACVAGTCVQDPMKCDDQDPCTADQCVPGTGCTYEPTSGPPCDDGSPCTLGDACVAGACVPGFPVCDCLVDADCTESPPDDCSEPACVNYACVAQPGPDGVACTSANPCAGGGSCAGGACVATAEAGCAGSATYLLRLVAPSAGRAVLEGTTYSVDLRSAPPGATQAAEGGIYRVRARRVEVVP